VTARVRTLSLFRSESLRANARAAGSSGRGGVGGLRGRVTLFAASCGASSTTSSVRSLPQPPQNESEMALPKSQPAQRATTLAPQARQNLRFQAFSVAHASHVRPIPPVLATVIPPSKFGHSPQIFTSWPNWRRGAQANEIKGLFARSVQVADMSADLVVLCRGRSRIG
jgi:hypothetical protein